MACRPFETMKTQERLYPLPDVALATLDQAGETLIPASQKVVRATTKFIRENPRTAIGIAALTAIALVLFLPQNRD
jgi:ElaB/YqjD/DUF883 family membrane-anchored ribosome-binding protein